MRHASSKARAFVKLLCLLLLFAQHAGLSHGVWHSAEGELSTAATGHVHDAHAGDEHQREHQSDAERGFCAFHGIFGTALGGHVGALPAFIAVAPDGVGALTACRTRTSVDSVPAVSRGPPTLL